MNDVIGVQVSEEQVADRTDRDGDLGQPQRGAAATVEEEALAAGLNERACAILLEINWGSDASAEKHDSENVLGEEIGRCGIGRMGGSR